MSDVHGTRRPKSIAADISGSYNHLLYQACKCVAICEPLSRRDNAWISSSLPRQGRTSQLGTSVQQPSSVSHAAVCGRATSLGDQHRLRVCVNTNPLRCYPLVNGSIKRMRAVKTVRDKSYLGDVLVHNVSQYRVNVPNIMQILPCDV